MLPDLPPNDIHIRFLYGLFEAHAHGTVAISGVLVCMLLVGIGRRLRLW